MKIIYHLPNQKGRSFFDINISNLIKKEKIKIACPYISINYFEDVIIKLSSDFQLLTDIIKVFCINLLLILIFGKVHYHKFNI